MNEYVTLMRTFAFCLCLAGLLAWLSGCSRPDDPAVVINKSRPAKLQSQLVQHMNVRIDDRQIDKEGATVIRDKEFIISGEYGEGHP